MMCTANGMAQECIDGEVDYDGKDRPIMITSDHDVINITTDSVLDNMRIVVKNEKERVIYDNQVTIVPGTNTFYVPTESSLTRSTIELYYGRMHLIKRPDEQEGQ